MAVKKHLIAFAALVSNQGAHADPRVEVQHSFEKVLATGGFRGYAQGYLFGPQLPPLSGDIEVVFPDRIHAATGEMEFIAIGERAWISTLGLWVATDRATLPVTTFDMAGIRRAIASIRDVRVEGTSKTSQCAAHVYRFSAQASLPDAPASGEGRAWVCDGSRMPARLEASDAKSGERLVIDFDWSRRADVRAPTR